MSDYNLAMDYDSYKVGHWLQFAPDARRMFYYIEPRVKDKTMVIFGLHAIIKEYFSNVPTIEQVEEAKVFWDKHVNKNTFNYEGWKKISKLGYYPVEILGTPEGTVLPSKNVIATVVNTDDEFYWLPGVMETLLMHVWYPITVATRSYEMKRIILKYLEDTGIPESVNFKLHDFGFRGVSSYQSAMMGGMAHLVNFAGTDTTAGIKGVWKYYDPEKTKPVVGFSINASEHSTMTSWLLAGEEEAYKNMLNRFAKPDAVMACVCDSYNYKYAIEKIWGEKLRDKVKSSGAIIVLRPDSGSPKEMVIYTLEVLADKYGYIINDKGYKVLNNVRIIQGDGISEPKVIEDILAAAKKLGYSTDNIAFGMGGGLLQQVNRDTYGFAMKASAKAIAREFGYTWVPVYKDPVDAPMKASRKGRVALYNHYGKYTTEPYNGDKNMALIPYYKNGAFFVSENFEDIRTRVASSL